MKKYLYGLLLAAIIFMPIGAQAADPANHIVISEIQTASSMDASSEFVELYNPTDSPVLLTDFTMEYASAAGTTWTKKATLTGSIPSHSFYLIATTGQTADAVMTSGLAGTSGHIRLKQSNGTVVDTVGWGAATKSEINPIEAPSAGGSIERLPGRLNELAGNWQDTDNNSQDFIVRTASEPQTTKSTPEDPNAVAAPAVEENPPAEEQIEPPPIPVYLPLYITEAFPDPASPLSDAADEFIELYNPNDQPVNAKGYVIRTGSSFKSFYTIGDVVIPANSYMSFFALTTHLGLTNSGGAVQLLDPLGNILDVTDAYGPAKTGQSWADINGSWMWTLEPTPGAANILSTPVATTKATTTTKAKATTKKAATKPKTTKAKAAKKTSKATTKKTKTKAPKTSIAAATSAIAEPSPLARWLLIAAGCFTILYAIYGFRHDLFNYYIKTRTNLATWLQSRPALSWRRNHRTR